MTYRSVCTLVVCCMCMLTAKAELSRQVKDYLKSVESRFNDRVTSAKMTMDKSVLFVDIREDEKEALEEEVYVGDKSLGEIASVTLVSNDGLHCRITPHDQADIAAIRQALGDFSLEYFSDATQVALLEADGTEIQFLTAMDLDDSQYNRVLNDIGFMYNKAVTQIENLITSEKTELNKFLQKNGLSAENVEANQELDRYRENAKRQLYDCKQNLEIWLLTEKMRRNKFPATLTLQGGNEVTAYYLNDEQDVKIADNVTLDGSKDYVRPAMCDPYWPFYVRNLTFSRSFVADGGVYSFCVPFCMRAGDVNGTFYDFDCYDEAANRLMFKEHTGYIEANRGYFFLPNEDIDAITVKGVTLSEMSTSFDANAVGICGTTVTMNVPEGAYGYMSDGAGGAEFVRAGAGNTMSPFRSFLWLGAGANAARARAVFVSQDGATSLTLPVSALERTDAPMYNTSGQCITIPRKGEIYIQNGRKYIAK